MEKSGFRARARGGFHGRGRKQPPYHSCLVQRRASRERRLLHKVRIVEHRKPMISPISYNNTHDTSYPLLSMTYRMVWNHIQNVIEFVQTDTGLSILSSLLIATPSLLSIIGWILLGRRWLDIIADFIQKRIPRSRKAKRNQITISGLYSLEQTKELKEGDPGFEEVVGEIINESLPAGESISSDDNVVKLERVRSGYKGVDPKERGVPKGLRGHIHAVMGDNTRKIAGVEDEERDRRRQLERVERRRRGRMRSLIKRFLISILGLCLGSGILIEIYLILI